MYIIWEGLDRSGKTTTRKLVEKQRNGKDIVIDRFIGSNIVYGKLYKRYSKEELQKLYNDEQCFRSFFDSVLIYLYAPVNVIIKRIEKDKHEKIDKIKLKKTSKEFNEYYKKCSFENKIKINTDKNTQKEVVNKILNYLKTIENENNI